VEPKREGDAWLDKLNDLKREGNERLYEEDSVTRGGKRRMEGRARRYLERERAGSHRGVV